jgi:hypothetical protein
MSNKGKKLLPKLGLDMSFDDALERFIDTKGTEVDELIRRGKQKKPPGAKSKPKTSGGSGHFEGVVDLRRRRMRKRSTGK